MYDLIGDIHGHVVALERLLSRLGYRETGGLWSHPERQAIFLGDFVDRGPDQVAVVALARAMVEAGQAMAVMGNHEFNAVAWASEDPERPGEYLRRHSSRNFSQHRAYLTQVGEGSVLHHTHLDWFRRLPLYLDLEGLRVVHACWHRPSLDALAPYLDARHRIRPEAWPVLVRSGNEAGDALDVVLKGLEVPLPSGHEFFDKDGHPRRRIRTRWWELDKITYRDLAMVPEDAIQEIPHDPIPDDVLPGYDGDKPLFVGHYWLTGTPAPLNRHIACLDYSIAAGASREEGGGKLCAYRWQGEQELTAEHMIWVEAGH